MITGERKRKYLNFFNKTLNGCRKLKEVKMITELDEKGCPICVVLFEWVNDCGNMQISIASRKDWVASKRFFRECFYYAFIECGAKICTAIVDTRREQAVSFNLRIGMKKEYDKPIKGFFGDFDGWLFCMKKNECKWLNGVSYE